VPQKTMSQRIGATETMSQKIGATENNVTEGMCHRKLSQNIGATDDECDRK